MDCIIFARQEELSLQQSDSFKHSPPLVHIPYELAFANRVGMNSAAILIVVKRFITGNSINDVRRNL